MSATLDLIQSYESSVGHCDLESSLQGGSMMKTPRLFLLLVAMAVLSLPSPAQESVRPDSLGLPGDNLNLYAVMRVFQESPTLEEFERKINSQEDRINNLDLDGDGNVDYIRVKDNVSDNDHSIVLQVQLSRTDSQDVAVIMVNKDQDNNVFVQMVGDEALYGTDYIVEPNYDRTAEKLSGETPNPAYAGNGDEESRTFDGEPVTVVKVAPVEVYRWPIVQYIYVGGYRPWGSPWYFGYYPPWWRPWRPSFWHAYWGYHYYQHRYYFGHYRRWHVYRYPVFHQRYVASYRVVSPVVAERRRAGAFRDTYSRPDLRREGVKQYRATRRPGPGVARPDGTWKREKRDATRPGGTWKKERKDATKPEGTWKKGTRDATKPQVEPKRFEKRGTTGVRPPRDPSRRAAAPALPKEKENQRSESRGKRGGGK
jgi:hypothetical protein